MARKKSENTWMLLAVLGVGGYLFWQYKQTQAPAAVASAAPGASDSMLLLPPSSALNSNAPSSDVVNTTNLVPMSVNNSNLPILSTGQSLALNAKGLPMLDNSGNPLVFQSIAPPIYNNIPSNCQMSEMAGGEAL